MWSSYLYDSVFILDDPAVTREHIEPVKRQKSDIFKCQFNEKSSTLISANNAPHILIVSYHANDLFKLTKIGKKQLATSISCDENVNASDKNTVKRRWIKAFYYYISIYYFHIKFIIDM